MHGHATAFMAAPAASRNSSSRSVGSSMPHATRTSPSLMPSEARTCGTTAATLALLATQQLKPQPRLPEAQRTHRRTSLLWPECDEPAGSVTSVSTPPSDGATVASRSDRMNASAACEQRLASRHRQQLSSRRRMPRRV